MIPLNNSHRCEPVGAKTLRERIATCHSEIDTGVWGEKAAMQMCVAYRSEMMFAGCGFKKLPLV